MNYMGIRFYIHEFFNRESYDEFVVPGEKELQKSPISKKDRDFREIMINWNMFYIDFKSSK